jgi:SAM-dependent methyltransferase
MASWDDGYVTDVTYTDNVYREMTPSWLALTAVLLGQRPPDLSRPFRYADLGCGFGMTAIFVAATCPQAEVWGFDFNPAHIEVARRCAADIGLTNITFVEASFADLAQLPPVDVPEFDFIVSHGVLSWVSAANRQHLFDVIGQRLCPGGLAYVSYNTQAGWASMLPLRELMRLVAAAGPNRTDQMVPAVLDLLDRARTGGARYFVAHPDLEARLNLLRKQNPRYFAHEFLNADWHPLMFGEVLEAMQDARCLYLGSATLSENFDVASVPGDMIPLLSETRDLRLRETLRDLGMDRGFRRDVYRRGLVQLMPLEQAALLEAFRFTRIGALPEGEVSFTTPVGTLTGRQEVYTPLLAVLREGPASIDDLRRADPARTTADVMQALTLLMGAGHIHPLLPDPAGGRATARALNRWIARANSDGADMPRLAAPAIGSMLSVDLLETLVVGLLLDGAAEDAPSLAQVMIAQLNRAGRSLQRDGQKLEDKLEIEQHARKLVQDVLTVRGPLLRALGVLGAD